MPGAADSAHSRRDFLAVTGVSAAVAVLPRVALAQPAAPATPAPAAPPAPDAPPVVPVDTIAAAEALAGISFTPTEREMMSKSIGDQVERIKHRQKLPPLPNDLAPALVFDPRLPGMTFDREQRPLVRSSGAVTELPSSDEDIAYAPLKTLSRWIESKKLKSRRLTDIYTERLHRLDPTLKFVVTPTDDLARKQADRADAEIAAGKYRGPLHGVPWGAKDLFDTANIPTTWGAEPFADRVPTRDAAVVRKLEAAGAVLAAKTTLGALAMGDVWHGGRTNNPFKLDRGSSGSSAGSAAAVASGCVGFAIGTETLGSIISPSRTCGSTGLRPTFGRVSRAGAMALCWSLDKVGPMARCAEDCALVLAAIHGADADDPSSLDMPFNFDATKPVKGLRVGYIPAALERKELHAAHKQAFEALKAAGCEMVEIELPDWPYDILLNILLCEAAAAFEDLTRSGKDDMLKSQDANAWPNSFRESWFVPGVEVIQTHRFRRQCMTMMRDKFANLDAILDPANNTGPLCIITNNTGNPSLTVRIGFRDDGTPVSTTLIGKLFDEGTLVRLGATLEPAMAVWERRPSV